jgi:hypothetical protein
LGFCAFLALWLASAFLEWSEEYLWVKPMDLQTTPSSLQNVAPSAGAPDVAGPRRQRANQDLPNGTAYEFAAAMRSALGDISAKLQEAKSVLGTSSQAQQQPALAEMFKGFGVLVDQLAQIYGDAAGVEASTAATKGAGGAVSTQTLPSTTSLAGRAANTGGGGVASATTSTAATAGAVVSSQAYSSTTDYDKTKADYLTRMQQSNPTDQWVIAALNKAIDQNVANGCDPEKSSAVNTLRGYFSGDAQARSRAIHSLDSEMLQAGGAYETTDYGLHIIAGAPPEGMNTTMPIFKSAYDKDWERPSLYDMINSAMGWPEKAGSYGDPSSRDAALNRKLSDAEIRAFQDGALTPELAALVTKYRGA